MEESAQLNYAVDEAPPHLISLLLGFQVVALILSGIVLTPLIALDAAGIAGGATDWVVFAALLISGVMTIVQAAPVGPIGAGYVLFMGTSGAFIAVSIGALKAGGLPLLGSLIAAASLIQFVFTRYLGVFRRIITPTVGGTVITLIAVTVMPIAYGMLDQVPTGYSGSVHSPMWAAAVTLVIIVMLSLFGNKALRLWGPVIGVVSGSLVGGLLGLVDLQPFQQASLVGLPQQGWPGLDLNFDARFWILLPGFLIVTIIGALETYGDGIAIQEVSQREVLPPDYRKVQGALNADGVGNLLSGLMGTLPNTTYSTSVSVADLTGVASRRVGLYGGVILTLLAFSPKVSALLQAIPAPVAAVFIFFLIVLLFAHGIRLITSDGFSFDDGIVFGVALWAGVGFQGQEVYHALMPDTVAQLLDNGMTTGGLVAVVLSWLVSLKRERSLKLTVPTAAASLEPAVQFLTDRAQRLGWRGAQLSRLQLALEEGFLLQNERAQSAEGRKTTLVIRGNKQRVEMELISAQGGDNIETLLREENQSESLEETPVRLRLLRGIANQISHQQFRNGDYLVITVLRSSAEGQPDYVR